MLICAHTSLHSGNNVQHCTRCLSEIHQLNPKFRQLSLEEGCQIYSPSPPIPFRIYSSPAGMGNYTHVDTGQMRVFRLLHQKCAASCSIPKKTLGCCLKRETNFTQSWTDASNTVGKIINTLTPTKKKKIPNKL